MSDKEAAGRLKQRQAPGVPRARSLESFKAKELKQRQELQPQPLGLTPYSLSCKRSTSTSAVLLAWYVLLCLRRC